MASSLSSTQARDLFQRIQGKLPTRFKSAWYLISACSAASLGLGQHYLPFIYRSAVEFLPFPAGTAAGDGRLPAVPDWEKDHPRRQVVRQIKEALVKSTILVGVGHCIEASFALGNALDERDKDDVCVRAELTGSNEERGLAGLDAVYKQNLPPIFQKMQDYGLDDIQWLSSNVTYGLLLAPVRPENPVAPLTLAESRIVTLTCLMSRHAHREVLWHLRGALRSGMTREEVEACQQAIEVCLKGVEETWKEQVIPEMPRVNDVTEEDDLS